MTTRWTTPEDIQERWIGSSTPTDNDLLTALILDAEAVILSEYPRIQERVDSEALNADIITMVTVRMVNRVLRNPDNVSYWQQNTGPFGQGRSFGDIDIWLTSEEKNLLAPRARGKAFEVDVAPNSVSPAQTVLDDDDIHEKWVTIK